MPPYSWPERAPYQPSQYLIVRSPYGQRIPTEAMAYLCFPVFILLFVEMPILVMLVDFLLARTVSMQASSQ